MSTNALVRLLARLRVAPTLSSAQIPARASFASCVDLCVVKRTMRIFSEWGGLNQEVWHAVAVVAF